MKHDKVSHCDKTGKLCYESESAASRAVNNYEDIKRYYICDSCNKYHITSNEHGEKKYSKFNKKYIQNRIDTLNQ